MWNPISIDQFVKIHLKNNPNDNEKVLKVQPLCLTCIKNNSDTRDDDVLCDLNRFGQMRVKFLSAVNTIKDRKRCITL